MGLEPLLVHGLADGNRTVEGLADLVLDVADDAVLAKDTPLEHIEHHAVLGKTERVTVHGRAADAGAGRVEELGVDEFLRVLLEVTLTALDDLTAGERTGVDTAEAVTLGVGPLVGVAGGEEHRVCELDVADPVAGLCTLGRGYNLPDGTVGFLLLGERRVGRRVGGSRRPVAEDQYDILISHVTHLFKFVAGVHLLSPVLGDLGCTRSVLGLVCHVSFHLHVGFFSTFITARTTSANFSLPGVCPRVTPLTISITMPLVFTRSGGGITTAVLIPSFARSSKSIGTWETTIALIFTCSRINRTFCTTWERTFPWCRMATLCCSI